MTACTPTAQQAMGLPSICGSRWCMAMITLFPDPPSGFCHRTSFTCGFFCRMSYRLCSSSAVNRLLQKRYCVVDAANYDQGRAAPSAGLPHPQTQQNRRSDVTCQKPIASTQKRHNSLIAAPGAILGAAAVEQVLPKALDLEDLGSQRLQLLREHRLLDS